MTKINRKLILPIAVLAAAALIAAFWFFHRAGDEHDHTSPLSLEQFKLADQYQYGDIEWGSPVNRVMSALPYSITADSRISGNLPEHVSYYISGNQLSLDGQSALASFEFYDNKLQTVKFDFHLDENYEEWYNKQVEALRQLYGKESDQMENSSSTMSSKGYKWEAGDTTLQLILLTGTSIKPAATLGVGVKQ